MICSSHKHTGLEACAFVQLYTCITRLARGTTLALSWLAHGAEPGHSGAFWRVASTLLCKFLPYSLVMLCQQQLGSALSHSCLSLSRAEATDVANAVLDGADGVLLGAETLRGKYPAITVKTVLAICRQAEEVFDYSGHFECLTLQGEQVSPKPACNTPASLF